MTGFHLHWLMRKLFLLCALLIGLVACSPPPSTTVRLPSGVGAPALTDSSFVALVDDMIASGNGDRWIVCYLQYDKSEVPPTTDEMEPLDNLGRNAWIVWVTATAVKQYMNHPNLRCISEYLPKYKYNKFLAETNVAWVYIEMFTDPSQKMVDDMTELGIHSIRYDFAPKRYYAKATGGQIVELADYWWVKNIYRARSRNFYF